MVGGWRKLHDKKTDNLYSSPNIIRMKKSWMIMWSGHVAFMGEERREICTKVQIGKPEGKRPLGRPKCKDRIVLELF
jgi:hypothetical protein